MELGELNGCRLHMQQPAAAISYSTTYTAHLDAALFWLQPVVRNVYVSS